LKGGRQRTLLQGKEHSTTGFYKVNSPQMPMDKQAPGPSFVGYLGVKEKKEEGRKE